MGQDIIPNRNGDRMMYERDFSIEEIGVAHEVVESGALGKVVVEL
jgi:hypothetical protein